MNSTPTDTLASSAASTAEPPTADTSTAKSADAASKTLAPTAAEKARDKNLILALLEEDPRDIRVCDQLGKPLPTDSSWAKMVGPERDNPVYEAFRVPMRAVFQEPVVASLLEEAFGYEGQVAGKSEEEKSGFFEKVGFYSRVAASVGTMLAKKSHFEALADRAEHLTLLAKLAVAKPELQNSSQFADFCRSIENADQGIDRASMIQERAQIVRLIRESGLKPADLEFDPEAWTKFTAKFDRGSVHFSMSSKEEPVLAE